jgi:hypothetical protein
MKKYIFVSRLEVRKGGIIQLFSDPIKANSIEEAFEQLPERNRYQIFSITK